MAAPGRLSRRAGGTSPANPLRVATAARALLGVLGRAAAMVFPDRCGACWEECEGPFCETCAESLVAAPAGCPVCGEPADEALLPVVRPRRCARCRERAPPFGKARAPYLHGGALAEAIWRLKYDGCEELARPLALLFDGCEVPRSHVVAPVPLHVSRLRERGYDQAALLARAAAQRFGLPCSHLLLRTRPTRAQVGLDRPRPPSPRGQRARRFPRPEAGSGRADLPGRRRPHDWRDRRGGRASAASRGRGERGNPYPGPRSVSRRTNALPAR